MMNPSRSIRLTVLIAVVALVASASVHADQRIPVRTLKPLLKLAIDQSSAQGVLVGDAAAFIRNKFNATAPIEIDVRTIRTLRDPACRRLEVTTRQSAVMESTQHEDKKLTYQLNYCRDGRMPERE